MPKIPMYAPSTKLLRMIHSFVPDALIFVLCTHSCICPNELLLGALFTHLHSMHSST